GGGGRSPGQLLGGRLRGGHLRRGQVLGDDGNGDGLVRHSGVSSRQIHAEQGTTSRRLQLRPAPTPPRPTLPVPLQRDPPAHHISSHPTPPPSTPPRLQLYVSSCRWGRNRPDFVPTKRLSVQPGPSDNREWPGRCPHRSAPRSDRPEISERPGRCKATRKTEEA